MSKPKRRRRRRTHPSFKPGAAPGTLTADESAPRPKITMMAFGPDRLVEKELAGPEEISGHLGKFPLVWVNVDGLGDAETIRKIGEIFSLHRLALEDVLNTHQRPKVEPYDDQIYIVAHMVSRTESLLTEQLSLFLGAGYVLTFQEREGDCLESVRTRIRKGGPRLRCGKPDYLTYAILDAVVDHYFPIVEKYGDVLETLQDIILARSDDDVPRRIYDIRSDLMIIRRALHPLRDAVNSLIRADTPLIEEGTGLYFRDCHDHTIQLIDLLQVDRETASGLMDLHLASVSNRMNDVMKILTVFASIFIPLTFIAGIYGMNFNTEASPWNLPELDWYWGYPLALGTMAISAVLMLWYFRKKGFFR